MLSQYEVLDPAFKKVFKENVKLHELTISSLQISKKEAVVVTNSYMYILRKKLFKISLDKLALKDITDINLKDSSLEIYTNKRKFLLKFSKDKKNLVKNLCKRLKKFL